jgi:hypothetical protein
MSCRAKAPFAMGAEIGATISGQSMSRYPKATGREDIAAGQMLLRTPRRSEYMPI